MEMFCVDSGLMYLVVHNDFKLELIIFFPQKYTICHDRPLSHALGHCKCCIRADLAVRKLVNLNADIYV